MNTDWEKEFDSKFSPGYIGWSTPLSIQKELRDFIRTQLTRQRLLDIEWLKEEVRKNILLFPGDVLTLLASRKAEIEKEI